MTETNGKGEYRCLNPEEIKATVLMFRNLLGWKQLTLAIEARVDERTVQRIERGEKVNDDTLRRIAKALRLQEDAFVGTRYVPTAEEARAKAEEVLSQVMVAEARSFATLKDCDSVLRTHGFIVDDRLVGDEIAEDLAAFKDLTRDWMDLYEDISASEQLEACKIVLKWAQRIEAKGYQFRFAAYTTEDRFDVAAFVLAESKDERVKDIKQLVVPRRFAEMAWSGSPV